MSADDALDGGPLDERPLRALVGPTAAGKSALALELAERAGFEVLSLDSMLVYRGMDVGTAKPTPDQRARVPHHLIDLVPPSERFDVSRWLGAAREALADLSRRERRGLFVGGTGFYLAALLRGLFEGPPTDPALRARVEARAAELGPQALHAELRRVDPPSAERLHPNDLRRVVRALEVLEQTGRPLSSWQAEWAGEGGPREARARVVGLELAPAQLAARIRARTVAMLDGGWREEALALREGESFGPSAVQALGYAEVLAWADGELTREQALERIVQRTRRFARRQLTWYRKFDVTWIPADAPDRAERALEVLGWC